MLGNSWVAAQLAASQEGLRSIELVLLSLPTSTLEQFLDVGHGPFLSSLLKPAEHDILVNSVRSRQSTGN
jgi:hypothetical protein